MSDMTDAQRKAARKALGNFIDVKVTLERDGEVTRLVPTKDGAAGNPVEIINEVTPPSQIERELVISCSALAGVS